MSTHTRDWDETFPADSQQLGDLADEQRKQKVDMRERMEVDHYWSGDSDLENYTADGYHKKVTLTGDSDIDSLTVPAGSCIFYSKEHDGVLKPFFKTSSGIFPIFGNEDAARGYLRLSLDGQDDESVAPYIPDGSAIELNDIIYLIDADTTPTGTLANGETWVVCEEDGSGGLEFTYSQTEPVWNHSKGWWYSSDGSKRYLIVLWYDETDEIDGTTYRGKRLVTTDDMNTWVRHEQSLTDLYNTDGDVRWEAGGLTFNMSPFNVKAGQTWEVAVRFYADWEYSSSWDDSPDLEYNGFRIDAVGTADISIDNSGDFSFSSAYLFYHLASYNNTPSSWRNVFSPTGGTGENKTLLRITSDGTLGIGEDYSYSFYDKWAKIENCAVTFRRIV